MTITLTHGVQETQCHGLFASFEVEFYACTNPGLVYRPQAFFCAKTRLPRKQRNTVRFCTIPLKLKKYGRLCDFPIITDLILHVFYIQVDLGEMVILTAVATQGRPGQTWAQFIKEYYVGYSSNGRNFTYLTNSKGNVKVSS